MNVLVINGPNINLIGKRQIDMYGKKSYQDLCNYIQQWAKELSLSVSICQSNYEGQIIDWIQAAPGRYQAIIINPAGYSHTSVAILDALLAVNLPTVEVHISDINQREDFRKHSYISTYANETIIGKGLRGYQEALHYLDQCRKER